MAALAALAADQAPKPIKVMEASSSAAGADVDLSAIDPTVNACQNFYEHACGGFIKSVALTPNRTEVSLMNQKSDANLTASLNKLFAIKSAPNTELQRLQTFYDSCLHDSASSSALVNAWISRIDAAKTPKEFQNIILSLSSIGVDPFFAYSGAPDPNDLGKYRGEIDYNGLWQDPAVVERAFLLAGIPAAQAKTDVEAVSAIVVELRKSRTTGRDLRAYENPTTLAQLTADASAIDWRAYFAMIGAAPLRPINVTSRAYLPAVSHELTTRSPAELRAYLRWAFLFSLRGELPPPYNQAFGDITPPLRVAVDQPDKRCQDATLRGMGVEFSRQYSQRILGLSARQIATEIGASIQTEIADAVQEATWLSPAARQATADKLRKTDLKMGFPDQWPAVGHFRLRPNAFLENVLAARRYEERRAWRRANEPRSRKNWDMLVFPWVGTGMAAARLTTPNAFPDPNTNSMIMTAAFLNAPLFDPAASVEANYGIFGAVFAHEFVHVAEEHDYDAIGRQREIWSAADIAAANNQHQCVIDQAEASAAPPGSHVSGERNYSENVADLGAIRLAYNALATKLGPRLNQADVTAMTPAKRFFYRFAQYYCTAATPETLQDLVADDPHALPSYRVNGPLSNLPAFSETFGCPADAPMRRPDDKICRVW
jgi:endothelin-converting enzyme/putative endopeptidase